MKAAKKAGKVSAELGNEGGPTLVPAAESIKPEAPAVSLSELLDGTTPMPTPPAEEETKYDADSVFGKLSEVKKEGE